MRRMLKGLLLSTCILFSSGMIVASCCPSTSSSSCCNVCCCTPCCCDTDCCDPCCEGYNHFAPRSQSWNTARGLVGWEEMLHKVEVEDTYGAFAITPHYTRSFRGCRITQFFFGCDLQGGNLVITGSRKGITGNGTVEGATERNAKDWLADYFGLPTDFETTVCFNPRVSNFMVDLDLFIGFDSCWECWDGLWMRLHAPITHTRWELCMSESGTVEGVNDFAMGYMAATTVLRADLPKTFKEAVDGTRTWGDMQEALKYDKMDNCTHTETRLSDIHLELGWDFWQCDDNYMGIALLVGFPTGNKPCPDWLFAPTVGNGGHFELGGVLVAGGNLWECDDESSRFDVYFEGKAAHLFKRSLYRSFDLKDKPNSRYMLIQELKTPGEYLWATSYSNATFPTNVTQSTYEYEGHLYPLINKTTCCTDVSIAVQGEASLKFAYSCDTDCGRWTFDLGYNIWGRTGEKFCGVCAIDKNKYALKGDAYIYGFASTDATATGITADAAYPLAATESGATIHSGTNTVPGTNFALADRQNPRIDNPQYAFASSDGLTGARLNYAPGLLDVATTANVTRTSMQPVFLKTDDLDGCKTPSALSHKVFAHFGFAWWDEDDDECDWAPFLGIGGEGEFSGKTCGCYTTLSQWGVWIKGGFSFS